MAKKVHLTEEQAIARDKKHMLIINVCGWTLTMGAVAGILVYAFFFGGGGI